MRVIWLSTLLHGYIGWRIGPQLPGIWAQVGLALLLMSSAVLIPVAFYGRRLRHRDRATADRLTWAGMLALGLFSMLFVLTVLRDVLLLVLLALPSEIAARWSGATGIAVPLLALAAALLGLANARRTARIRKVDVPIAGLPAALHGFTI